MALLRSVVYGGNEGEVEATDPLLAQGVQVLLATTDALSQPLQVEAETARREGGQEGKGAREEETGATPVATEQVMKAGRCLDEPLIEVGKGCLLLLPKFL